MAITTIPSSGTTDGTNLVKISSSTASGDSSIIFEFTGSYKVYLVKYFNVHTSADAVHFKYNFSTDGTNYNVSKVSAGTKLFQNESNTTHIINIDDTLKQANFTGDGEFIENVGNDNDENFAGEFRIFNPHSTTYQKHFQFNSNFSDYTPAIRNDVVVGYANTTSAITHVKFLPNTGTIDDGTFTLYGVRT